MKQRPTRSAIRAVSRDVGTSASGNADRLLEVTLTELFLIPPDVPWTVTTTGPYAPRYFIRVAKTGDPNAAISYGLGNGSITADQRSIVDAGFLVGPRRAVLRP